MRITEIFLLFIKQIMSVLYIAGAALQTIKYLYQILTAYEILRF